MMRSSIRWRIEVSLLDLSSSYFVTGTAINSSGFELSTMLWNDRQLTTPFWFSSFLWQKTPLANEATQKVTGSFIRELKLNFVPGHDCANCNQSCVAIYICIFINKTWKAQNIHGVLCFCKIVAFQQKKTAGFMVKNMVSEFCQKIENLVEALWYVIYCLKKFHNSNIFDICLSGIFSCHG